MFRRNFIKNSLFGVLFANMFGKTNVAYANDDSTYIDLNMVKNKKSIMVKKDGKPFYAIYRTDNDIRLLNEIEISNLIDPENDIDRAIKKNYLVVSGVCPHQGCIVSDNQFSDNVAEKFICPCHGSKFDASGRCVAGPAESNLEIPKYEIINNKIKLI